MKTCAALLAMLLLCSCGADGAPEPPAPGMTMSGSVTAGVARNGN